MHLDTRLMILAKDKAIVHAASFQSADLDYLKSKYQCIEVTDAEAKALATNVIALNPETLVVERRQHRLQSELIQHGFKVEAVDYSEPIILGGSFRCTTLTLSRDNG